MIYSFWAKIDLLVVAPLVLERESGTVEALFAGRVAQIRVQEGDEVDSRTELLELRQTRVTDAADSDTPENRHLEILEKIEELENDFYHTQRRLDISLENVRRDRAMLNRRLLIAEEDVTFWQEKLQLARQTFQQENSLLESNGLSPFKLGRGQTRVDELEKSVRQAQAEVKQIQASMEALDEVSIQNELKQVKSRFTERLSRLQQRLTATEQSLEEHRRLLQDVAQHGGATLYKSPFAGLVTRIYVKRGEIVASGIPLVSIVKKSAALEARVLVQNRDIGHLHRGQKVHVKYFAFPYQEYEIANGVISSIANTPGGVVGQESMYVVRVALEKEVISRAGEPSKSLGIGLEGIAEIKIGEKRFIEVLFSPISRFFSRQEG
ncbi:MAG: HlyD family efflux transporter periplasmic adaptor subunit [Magnetococcus sp. DMHC-6]